MNARVYCPSLINIRWMFNLNQLDPSNKKWKQELEQKMKIIRRTLERGKKIYNKKPMPMSM